MMNKSTLQICSTADSLMTETEPILQRSSKHACSDSSQTSSKIRLQRSKTFLLGLQSERLNARGIGQNRQDQSSG